MGLGASWWSGLGVASQWAHDFVGYRNGFFTFTGSTSLWLMICVSRLKIFQIPFAGGGGGGGDQAVQPSWDTGYFFFSTLAGTGARFNSANVGLGGISGSSNPKPQWVEIRNGILVGASGDLEPSADTVDHHRAYYKTGFVYDAGATRQQFRTG